MEFVLNLGQNPVSLVREFIDGLIENGLDFFLERLK
jgi:hypothetical protein